MSTSLDFRGYEPKPAAIAARYRSWAETSGYPDLVRTLFVVRSTPTGEGRLFQIHKKGSDPSDPFFLRRMRSRLRRLATLDKSIRHSL
jgi:hypothetical protein